VAARERIGVDDIRKVNGRLTERRSREAEQHRPGDCYQFSKSDFHDFLASLSPASA
jgi:hypothetical protein